jgi:hypothetical protein
MNDGVGLRITMSSFLKQQDDNSFLRSNWKVVYFAYKIYPEFAICLELLFCSSFV